MSKTLDDILAEERKNLTNWSWIDEITAPDEDGYPNDYARRVVTLDVVLDALSNIEAAVKREREKTVAQDATVSGNAAAMRVALNQLRTWAVMDINENAASADETNYKKLLDGFVEITNAALAKPARNCDVGTADEQTERFMHYCVNGACNRRGIDCGCGYEELFRHKCALKWAQMPYEKNEESSGGK